MPGHGADAGAHPLQKITWDELKIGKLLGNGGFADVYLGQWQGTHVAVKQLRASTLPKAIHDAFIAEATVHAGCHTPRIVRLLGISDAPGKFALILEYLPQGSLYDTLHNQEIALPWPTRWQIAIDIGSGLAYLHGKGIFHRDLKSMNVLLDKDMRAKISDFGQAMIKTHTQSSISGTQSSTSGTQAKGTIRWRAPETFKRRYRYVASADIYSYGVVLWELVTRALPYADESNDTVVMGFIKDGETEDIPADCPAAFAQPIQAAWQQEPTKRPAAAELARELEQSQPAMAAAAAKSWHFSNTYRHSATNEQGYSLFKADQADIDKVLAAYHHHPVPGHEIKAIEVIHNPVLNAQFGHRITQLNARAGNPAFAPKWSKERHSAQRQQAIEWQRAQSRPHRDDDAPHAQIQPLWHGMPGEAFASVCQTGYANLAKTDGGFFGKGIYNTNAASYAHRCYATMNGMQLGVLVMNWVVSYSAYPVVHGDMDKLSGKGNYQNYDAHLIPVKPNNPANPKEMNYYPCKPGEVPQYHEMVVFEQASCLPRYRVTLVASAGPGSSLSVATLPGQVDYDKGYQLHLRCQYRAALPLLEAAAQAGYPPAYLRLWIMHNIGGCIGPKDKSKANHYRALAAAKFAWFQAAAQKGDAYAQTNLGVCYSNGIGVAKDAAQAAAWYRKAAAQGDAYAQTNLGWCFEHGRGVVKDSAKAVEWYQKAAAQGYAPMQTNLGRCYADGIGVVKDAAKAVEWYRKAAAQDFAEAQFRLGCCFETGTGVVKDAAKAVEWYQKAAAQGDADAQDALRRLGKN